MATSTMFEWAARQCSWGKARCAWKGEVLTNLWCNADLHQAVSPAALEALTAFTGIIVEHDVQYIVAWGAECGGGGCFACKSYSRRAACQLLHFRAGAGKNDFTRPAKLRPAHSHRRTETPRWGAGRRREPGIILGPNGQTQRSSDLCDVIDSHAGGPLRGRAVFVESQHWRRVSRCRFKQRRDFVVGMEARGDDHSLAIGNDRPGQLVLAEICGDLQGEHPPLPARQEVRWLALIGTARLNPVVRSGRDIHFLLRIAIEITQEQA